MRHENFVLGVGLYTAASLAPDFGQGFDASCPASWVLIRLVKSEKGESVEAHSIDILILFPGEKPVLPGHLGYRFPINAPEPAQGKLSCCPRHWVGCI